MVASFAPSQLSFPHRSSARRLRPAAGGHRTPGHVAAYRQRHQPPLLDLTAGAAVRWQNSAVPRRRAHLALRAERAAGAAPEPTVVNKRKGKALIVRPHTGGHGGKLRPEPTVIPTQKQREDVETSFSTSPRAPLCGGRTRRCLGGGHTSPCGR